MHFLLLLSLILYIVQLPDQHLRRLFIFPVPALRIDLNFGVIQVLKNESSVLIRLPSAPVLQLQYKGSRHVSHPESANKGQGLFQPLTLSVYESHYPAKGKSEHCQEPSRYPAGAWWVGIEAVVSPYCSEQGWKTQQKKKESVHKRTVVSKFGLQQRQKILNLRA